MCIYVCVYAPSLNKRIKIRLNKMKTNKIIIPKELKKKFEEDILNEEYHKDKFNQDEKIWSEIAEFTREIKRYASTGDKESALILVEDLRTYIKLLK